MASIDKRKIYWLFLFSGISGLVYETVWLRILTRILGSTVYATSIVLAAFMAGLAVGSYMLGAYSGRSKNLLRMYSFLEMGIGVSALALLLALGHLVPIFRGVYGMSGGERVVLTLFQSVLLFLILLIPTSLMGGTLPVLAAYTQRFQSDLAGRVGILYGLNTIGAVLGVAVSGLWSIGQIGESRTVLAGALINMVVAYLAYVLSRSGSAAAIEPEMRADAAAPSVRPDRAQHILLAIYGLSGFVAMSYEIVWTRIFQIQIGTSIYSFSMMLTFYLIGLALGSLAAARWIGRSGAPRFVFVTAQIGIACWGVAGIHLFPLFQPITYLPRISFGNMALMPLVIIMPLTLLLGFIFPVVAKLYVRDGQYSGGGIGQLYAANTIGCIAGSLLTGFLLLGALGSRGTMIALALVNVGIALAVVFTHRPVHRPRTTVLILAGGGLVTLLLSVTAPDPFLASMRKILVSTWKIPASQATILYHHEGATATTTAFVTDSTPGGKQLWINGVGMTHLCTETKIMAHLPLLMHDDPHDILVICFGMGTALRSAWKHRSVRCDVVEIVPDVYRCFGFFHADGPEILADPRVSHHADDGRNFLLMGDRRYDVITMDPAPPLYSAGTVNLYTKEYFQLCRDHLRPGGIMCLWIPPDRFSEVRMIMKSFAIVFPKTLVWGGPSYPGLYMTGFNGPITVHPEHFAAADRDPALTADLAEWDAVVPRPSAMLQLLVLDDIQLQAFVQDARSITDDMPYTEFPLWRSVNDPTYNWMLNAVTLSSWRSRNFGGTAR